MDKRITIHRELPEKAILVIGDPSQLQNAFMNILINATHAMPEGGDIFVSARCLELDEMYCESTAMDIKPGLFAEIEIRDTGSGIPKENQKRIFEPFYTTKEQGKGTGLGLSAVFGTIQQHKGAIRVYSEIGSGTCFHILLPLIDEGVQAESIPSEQLLRGSGTILLVDDEAIMQATASSILRELGYEILLAEDGKQGLELFTQEAEHIDLVILDMVMPEMNGRDCFFAMKKLQPDVRVLLSSGFSREEEVESMKAEGLLGFVRKPYRSTVLSKAVSNAMKQKL